MADLKEGLSSLLAKEVYTKARILTIDIETKPNSGFHWGLWQQNIGLNQIIEVSEVMCFAAKWYGAEDTIFHAGWGKTPAQARRARERMVKQAHRLLDEADVIVHYNGARFDIPNLRREFVLAGMPPPTPHKDIDLLKVVKSEFRFASNKLDHVAQQLGLGHKTEHTGFQLWIDCMAGKPEAWGLMEQYNRQDVLLTESLLDRLRPWIKGHPQLGLFTGNPHSCPNCGTGIDLEELTGVAHTNVQSYAAGRCPQCGHPVRGTERLAPPTKIRSVR